MNISKMASAGTTGGAGGAGGARVTGARHF